MEDINSVDSERNLYFELNAMKHTASTSVCSSVQFDRLPNLQLMERTCRVRILNMFLISYTAVSDMKM